MQNYLVENGIPKKDILVEDKARSTFENIKYSLELIKEKCDLEIADLERKRIRNK